MTSSTDFLTSFDENLTSETETDNLEDDKKGDIDLAYIDIKNPTDYNKTELNNIKFIL